MDSSLLVCISPARLIYDIEIVQVSNNSVATNAYRSGLKLFSVSMKIADELGSDMRADRPT